MNSVLLYLSVYKYNTLIMVLPGADEEVDETSALEDFEDKLKDTIDGLTQKRYIVYD